ncbi:MAG: hypothetical protein L0J57_07430 [Brachybacterium sp.]|uniref:hypothetical protein n=1 Tax=Brachybacterium sp. TaxID=1891286 RepID=UPI00264E270B|nr:hypothetical protein [Brachybacterium sp.]MDN6302862.1 hypothetical protein [Brachybacterium sp.]MDN6329975.1 hypothetical protein [Brachybacterium sp.]MDN6398968.1 hypothetical protein [Brachybacterium sp.]
MSGTGIVLALGELVAAPSPSDGEEFTSVTVSPGLPGFLAMFVLAVAVVLLAIDMTRRTRRVQARARVQERMAAEDREQEDAAQEHPAGDDTETRAGEEIEAGDEAGAGGAAEAEDLAEESSLEETPTEDTSNPPHPGQTPPEQDGISGDDRR